LQEAIMAAATETIRQAHEQPVPPRRLPAKTGWWASVVMSGWAALFLAFDTVVHLLVGPAVMESFGELGFPVSQAVGLGVLEGACLVLYLIPRTSVLGAILLTGYLGGAVASQVRIGSPLFSHVLFPTYVGVLVWGGLFIRERRLRDLIPLRSSRER
jgi:hypothetical protein